MIPLSADFQARLLAGVTTLAWCWRVTRRDGVVFGFTEHDRDVACDGTVFAAASGFAGGAAEAALGFSADAGGVYGALSAEAITAADLANGLWDGARVEILRVDWAEPSVFARVWTGELGATRRGEAGFEAELQGLSHRLGRATGRVFSRRCDAALGDARCGVDLEASAYRAEGSVARGVDARRFEAAGLGGFADGWFADGALEWVSGANAGAVVGVAAHRVSGGVALIELDAAPGVVVAEGDGFVLRAGCDKRASTCRAKFSNLLNFRGFPHMPGTDALIVSPASERVKDGSSRGGMS